MSLRFTNLHRILLFAVLMFWCEACTTVAIAAAAETPAPPPIDKIDQLTGLLSDPGVKAWLAEQGKKTAELPASPDNGAGAMASTQISSALDMIRGHMESILAAVPALPAQFAQAWAALRLEFEDAGIVGIVALILGLVAVGLGMTWAVFRLTHGYREWHQAMPKTTPQNRIRNLGARLVYAAILITTFTVGTAGVFLVFNWPPLLRQIVLGYLSVAIVTWVAITVTRAFLLPPSLGIAQSGAARVFPMSDARAEHWLRWNAINVFWLMFVSVTLSLLGIFGFDRMGLLALSVPASAVQLLLMIAAVWLRPSNEPTAAEEHHTPKPKTWSWLLSLYFTLLWAVYLLGGTRMFWLLAASVALPLAIAMTKRGTHYVLRAPEPETGASPLAPVVVATIERAIRLVLIAGSVFFLIMAWSLDVSSITSGDAIANRILRGLLNAAVIVLAADFGWNIIKALIARQLQHMPDSDAGNGVQDPKQARLRTLLPIFQNMLFATIVVITALMVLSSMGVEIGPLIAGAGVIGVAIGFGAQTLVKDVIAGIFYLLDDAFRVGEYIQSGKYMGTVEGFSLRSVRLRHHRGYLFTVPFGELGAVQNMSRDWVIDKFNITVAYSSDLEKARRIVKKIGLTLAEDPEFAPYIIEPLKMQGVQNFGDYGIQLRMKMMTKPGQQMTIRRKAYIAIKAAFEEAGIELPFPTVHVQEGGTGRGAAVAQLQRNAKMEAEAEQAEAAS